MNVSQQGLQAKLESLQQAGLYRSLRRMDSVSDRTVCVDGRELLMCASNNYLGLVNDHRLVDAAVSATKEYGTGSSGSRLTTGNTVLHERLEACIAEFKGTESAIVFNTGYMANLAAMTTLAGVADVIFSDALNHASLIDGCRLSQARVVVYQHANIEDLARKLADTPCGGQRLIVTDGVFSMDGDIAPLPELALLAGRFDAWLMVDDAHATGVLGTQGKGTAEHFGLSSKDVPIQMGTLSKAVAAEGGYIAGSRVLIDYLRNFARPFIFSTALAPGVVATAMQSLKVIRAEKDRRNRLQKISAFVRAELAARGFRLVAGETPILAVLIGEADKAVAFARQLEDAGIFAPAIRPPSVPIGHSRIRLTLMATHTDTDLRTMIDTFTKVGQIAGVIS